MCCLPDESSLNYRLAMSVSVCMRRMPGESCDEQLWELRDLSTRGRWVYAAMGAVVFAICNLVGVSGNDAYELRASVHFFQVET